MSPDEIQTLLRWIAEEIKSQLEYVRGNETFEALQRLRHIFLKAADEIH